MTKKEVIRELQKIQMQMPPLNGQGLPGPDASREEMLELGEMAGVGGVLSALIGALYAGKAMEFLISTEPFVNAHIRPFAEAFSLRN